MLEWRYAPSSEGRSRGIFFVCGQTGHLKKRLKRETRHSADSPYLYLRRSHHHHFSFLISHYIHPNPTTFSLIISNPTSSRNPDFYSLYFLKSFLHDSSSPWDTVWITNERYFPKEALCTPRFASTPTSRFLCVPSSSISSATSSSPSPTPPSRTTPSPRKKWFSPATGSPHRSTDTTGTTSPSFTTGSWHFPTRSSASMKWPPACPPPFSEAPPSSSPTGSPAMSTTKKSAGSPPSSLAPPSSAGSSRKPSSPTRPSSSS